MQSYRRIKGISCSYKEYRLTNGKWHGVASEVFTTNSDFINNMIEASNYFSQLGGKFFVDCKSNRRFGVVPTKLVSISICGKTKKVYSLNYNQAQV